MKIKLYIVTYKNEFYLNHNLTTLFQSDLMSHDYQITIINNHTDFKLDPKFVSKVKVLHNVVRPDFSTGHLARDWNCALINGFQSLTAPDCDIVIHCQDDTHFNADWCANIVDIHKRFTFIQAGWGDCFCSYTVEAVRNIGLWDERFCNIGQQEADYLLRALMYNKDKSTINDGVHRRTLNVSYVNFITRPEHAKPDYHLKSTQNYNIYSDAVYIAKYGFVPGPWTDQLRRSPPTTTLIPNFITYPYFEKDIYDLNGKNYILRDNVKIIR